MDWLEIITLICWFAVLITAGFLAYRVNRLARLLEIVSIVTRVHGGAFGKLGIDLGRIAAEMDDEEGAAKT